MGLCNAIPLAVYVSTTHKGEGFKALRLKKMTNQEKFLRAKEPFATETVFWRDRYLLNERDVMPGPFAHARPQIKHQRQRIASQDVV